MRLEILANPDPAEPAGVGVVRPHKGCLTRRLVDVDGDHWHFRAGRADRGSGGRDRLEVEVRLDMLELEVAGTSDGAFGRGVGVAYVQLGPGDLRLFLDRVLNGVDERAGGLAEVDVAEDQALFRCQTQPEWSARRFPVAVSAERLPKPRRDR